MPKFTFHCDKCNSEKQVYCGTNEVFICDACSSPMRKKIPKKFNSEVTETIDSHTNMKWTQDSKALLKERHQDHYWKVEVPRMVNSGTYTVQTMLEQGWIWIDDAGKVHVHDKPPGKR